MIKLFIFRDSIKVSFKFFCTVYIEASEARMNGLFISLKMVL